MEEILDLYVNPIITLLDSVTAIDGDASILLKGFTTKNYNKIIDKFIMDNIDKGIDYDNLFNVIYVIRFILNSFVPFNNGALIDIKIKELYRDKGDYRIKVVYKFEK